MLDARQLDGFIAGLFEEVLKFRTIKIVENSFFFCSIPLTAFNGFCTIAFIALLLHARDHIAAYTASFDRLDTFVLTRFDHT